ncbi:hypothetical protein TBR22_A14410 [Luteitalea sp. TBR-22]|uniref:DUF429 domain-containing protein n=1 Tax=Luteitalea sp. TBR-22 TaxID=2802971 RepID=UPI001AF937FD|nr:DUF429 domain-containing protein [Luteitalea sp. TBR-22]BCS32231.1 hypothetical protein TBR22_A14410 [Luteitalea sp. TBR-22]
MARQPLVHIVGIDCATREASTGVCLATWDGRHLTIAEACTCRPDRTAEDAARGWLADAPSGIVALDAPLGWPDPLTCALADHQAGGRLPFVADDLFARETDRAITRRHGRTPPHIDGNQVARTSLAALHLLSRLREDLGRPIPLAWASGAPDGLVAIEVFPAATARAHGQDGTLPSWVTPNPHPAMTRTMHARDAILSAVAAVDMLEGRAVPPRGAEQERLSRREGWIWAR